jgi:penicillin amidase
MAALGGGAFLQIDQTARVHRLRQVARQSLVSMPAEQRQLVEAYAEGVNAGIALLEKKPFEYLVLQADPAPWRPEDSLLVLLAMFTELQSSDGKIESTLGSMHDLLPGPLFEFLAPRGTEWDAPLIGPAYTAPAIPGPEVIDLRSLPRAASLYVQAGRETPMAEPDLVPGSNSWAVAGNHTADGGALVANDMHLGLAVPNIWYRASLLWQDGQGGHHRVTGVTLPGLPMVIVGSNGFVAWAFTNSQTDASDVVLVETPGAHTDSYRTPEGDRPLDRYVETIQVKGRQPKRLEVLSTSWGPLLAGGREGRRQAISWVAHHPEAVDLGLVDLETARNVSEVVEAAHRSGAPAQNIVAADAAGHLVWTVLGRLPRRVGFDGRLPTSWADGDRGWRGWLKAEEVPVVLDPPSGLLWTANNRVVDSEGLARLGESAYALGARARQIRDRLMALEHATPQDLLDLQLDDRALFLQRWRDLLLRTLTPEALAKDPRRRELRRLVAGWTGHASVDSAGYRLVREFRLKLLAQVFEPLLAPCKRVNPDFDYRFIQQSEGPLWRLVTEQPMHLLDPRFRNWQESLTAAVDAVLGEGEHSQHPASSKSRAPWSRALAGHAAAATAGRFQHAPGAASLPGSIRADGRLPRTGGERYSSYAGGAERAPDVSPLPRRPRSLGLRKADPLPARSSGQYSEIDSRAAEQRLISRGTQPLSTVMLLR